MDSLGWKLSFLLRRFKGLIASLIVLGSGLYSLYLLLEHPIYNQAPLFPTTPLSAITMILIGLTGLFAFKIFSRDSRGFSRKKFETGSALILVSALLGFANGKDPFYVKINILIGMAGLFASKIFSKDSRGKILGFTLVVLGLRNFANGWRLLISIFHIFMGFSILILETLSKDSREERDKKQKKMRNRRNKEQKGTSHLGKQKKVWESFEVKRRIR